MKKLFLIISIFLFSVSPLFAGDKISVVTSLTDLKSITELVGGDHVDVFAIATGYQNPHFVDPKPSYIIKLSRADMFVTVGLDLETGWVPPLLNSARNSDIMIGGKGYVDASVNIPLLQVPSQINRGEGDIHIYGNPHYWLDPLNGKIIAENIYEKLVSLAPQFSNDFKTNLDKFNKTIDEKLLQWEALTGPYKGTKVMAYHNEWPYFESRFGLKIADFLEPKPGIPPTPSQLAKVIAEMKNQGIKIIINSPYFQAKSADLVADKTGGVVVELATSVGAFDGIETYYDLFDYNIDKIVNALKK